MDRGAGRIPEGMLHQEGGLANVLKMLATSTRQISAQDIVGALDGPLFSVDAVIEEALRVKATTKIDIHTKVREEAWTSGLERAELLLAAVRRMCRADIERLSALDEATFDTIRLEGVCDLLISAPLGRCMVVDTAIRRLDACGVWARAFPGVYAGLRAQPGRRLSGGVETYYVVRGLPDQNLPDMSIAGKYLCNNHWWHTDLSEAVRFETSEEAYSAKSAEAEFDPPSTEFVAEVVLIAEQRVVSDAGAAHFNHHDTHVCYVEGLGYMTTTKTKSNKRYVSRTLIPSCMYARRSDAEKTAGNTWMVRGKRVTPQDIELRRLEVITSRIPLEG
jgi:hypothetical protein